MTRPVILQDFLAAEHDHADCIEHALSRAQAVCQAQGERLTPLRRDILALVWASHKPVKAYELLGQLSLTHGRMAPPTVYRILDFLQSLGLVHRLESLNCYIGCADPTHRHEGQFFICERCGTVAEFVDGGLQSRLSRTAASLGFQMSSGTIEIAGLCQRCQ
jgi:Fur family zinc uptake transcriptional regulator